MSEEVLNQFQAYSLFDYFIIPNKNMVMELSFQNLEKMFQRNDLSYALHICKEKY